MLLGFKTELKLNHNQRTGLVKHCGVARHAGNWGLALTKNILFDLQQIENPEISGVEYSQGELFGYEVREYLLSKWDRKCAYCGAKNTPLQVEHIQLKANGRTNRISNLCLACEPCNSKKGTKDIKKFIRRMVITMDFKDCRRLKPLPRFPRPSLDTEFPSTEVF